MTDNAQAHSLITVRVPMALRRYGALKRIVAPDGGEISSQPRQPDNTLVKALSRAFRWRKLLECGKFNTISELAESEKINPSYVSRVLRLTLLAPDIVEAILSASLDRTVTIDRLMKPLPADWQAQRQLLCGSQSRLAADSLTR